MLLNYDLSYFSDKSLNMSEEGCDDDEGNINLKPLPRYQFR